MKTIIKTLFISLIIAFALKTQSQTIPDPNLNQSENDLTISQGTMILKYVNETNLYLLVDKKWIPVKETENAKDLIWKAANNPEKLTIVVAYKNQNQVVWIQVRTRWASDPKWGI